MNGQNNSSWEKYSRQTHIIGRTASIAALIMLVGAPFLIGKYLGAMPDLSATAKGFFSVGIIWFVSSIAEFIIYTPMLGSGGTYLGFVTGNLSNLKVPCALNCMEQAGVEIPGLAFADGL